MDTDNPDTDKGWRVELADTEYEEPETAIKIDNSLVYVDLQPDECGEVKIKLEEIDEEGVNIKLEKVDDDGVKIKLEKVDEEGVNIKLDEVKDGGMKSESNDEVKMGIDEIKMGGDDEVEKGNDEEEEESSIIMSSVRHISMADTPSNDSHVYPEIRGCHVSSKATEPTSSHRLHKDLDYSCNDAAEKKSSLTYTDFGRINTNKNYGLFKSRRKLPYHLCDYRKGRRLNSLLSRLSRHYISGESKSHTFESESSMNELLTSHASNYSIQSESSSTVTSSPASYYSIQSESSSTVTSLNQSSIIASIKLTDNGNFKCGFCMKKFPTSQILQSHLRRLPHHNLLDNDISGKVKEKNVMS